MLLSELKVGECCKVKSLNVESGLRRRLLEFGMLNGTNVKCVLKAPHGDPTAYEIRNTVIALRRCDAEKIEITEKGD